MCFPFEENAELAAAFGLAHARVSCEVPGVLACNGVVETASGHCGFVAGCMESDGRVIVVLRMLGDGVPGLGDSTSYPQGGAGVAAVPIEEISVAAAWFVGRDDRLIVLH